MTMPSTGSSVITAESGQDDPNAPAQRFFRLYTTDALVCGAERLVHLRPGLEYPISRSSSATPTFSRAWRIGASVDRSS